MYFLFHLFYLYVPRDYEVCYVRIQGPNISAVADADLQTGGGGLGRSYRPWDKVGAVSKNFFRPFGPQFGLKIRGRAGPGAPPLDPPLYLLALALYS